MTPKHKKLLKVLATILALVAIGVGLYFLLRHLGVTDQASLQRIIKSAGAWGPIVFFLLQVSMAVLLSVVPGTNLTFLILAGTIFDNIFLAVFLALLGVWTSSILLFVVGDTLGEKVAIKLVGADDLKKAQDLIDTKSKIYLPIMFLFPFFPDDALCLTAGMTKMKYRYFIPMVMVFRSIGALTTVLTSYYSQDLFVFLGLNNLSPVSWIMLANLIAFDVFVVYKFTKWLEKKMNAKKMAVKVLEGAVVGEEAKIAKEKAGDN